MVSSRNIGSIKGYNLYIYKDLEPLQDDWTKLQSEKYCYIYQHYDWVRIASETINKHDEICIVVARQIQTNDIAFIMPMVIEAGAVKILRWFGKTHATINAPVFSEDFIHSENQNVFRDVFDLLSKSISGMVITRLENQPYKVGEADNPLMMLEHSKSVNTMFVIDLSGGLEGVLNAGNAKRKRKNFRKQKRAAENVGSYEITIPENREAIITAIDEFRNFKKIRFKQMGIKDVFADDDTKQFLELLGCEPFKDNHQVFEIIQLKVGGETRALYAGGIIDDYFQASINAIAIDDYTENSPGEFLLYLMIEKLVERGFKKLDLGVGSERYKHSWCQHEYELFDTIMPLSTATKPIVAGLKLKNATKGYLRSNKTIWPLIKKFRRLKGNL